jgi:hypothetical protein
MNLDRLKPEERAALDALRAIFANNPNVGAVGVGTPPVTRKAVRALARKKLVELGYHRPPIVRPEGDNRGGTTRLVVRLASGAVTVRRAA